MIKKAVYSQWSKPANDSHIGFNSKKAFYNCALLSLINSKKWFEEVELITDEEGYNLLIKELQLPFDSVKVELDSLNYIDKKHWAIGKLKACSLQDTPFMHLDFDVIWFKRPPDYLLNAEACFQNIEEGHVFNEWYRGYIKDAVDQKVNNYFSTEDNYAYNCGFMGFNNLNIIDEWYNSALDFIDKFKSNKKNLVTSLLFEQYAIYKLCELNNYKVEIIEEAYKDEVTTKYGYTHLLSVVKRRKDIEEKVKKKLEKELNLI